MIKIEIIETSGFGSLLFLRCCGQDHFKVFQLPRDHPLHLRCVVCQTEYCPEGECDGVFADASREM